MFIHIDKFDPLIMDVKYSNCTFPNFKLPSVQPALNLVLRAHLLLMGMLMPVVVNCLRFPGFGIRNHNLDVVLGVHVDDGGYQNTGARGLE